MNDTPQASLGSPASMVSVKSENQKKTKFPSKKEQNSSTKVTVDQRRSVESKVKDKGEVM